MSKRKKRLEKIRQNPKNVRRDELDSTLQDAGFSPDFTAGSHTTYRHSSGMRITVAAHDQFVPAYIVRQALKAIDSLPKTGDDSANDDDENDDEQDSGRLFSPSLSSENYPG